MPADDEMTIAERYKYLKKMEGRYRAAEAAGRSALLTEMKQVTGLHRKSLVRLLRPDGLVRHRRQTQRGRTYGPAVDDVIRVVWESLDYLCAERLTPTLLPTAQHLAGFGELQLGEELAVQLGTISRGTVQRRLTQFQRDLPRLPRRGPAQANALRKEIPMLRLPWDIAEPGHCEVALVHHCGSSASGDYVHTLQLIDIATGWSERVGVLGRSYRAMEEGFDCALARLPFPIIALHPDNGAEFFSAHLLRYFGRAMPGLRLSRSRPYKKNDNRFVEQKNDSLVRAYIGYERLDTAGQCAALNQLYDQMWIYYNLFQPVLRLQEKEVLGGKTRRRWDVARTPYERLRETTALRAEAAAQLAATYATTNPRELRRQIHAAIPAVWAAAAPDELVPGVA